MYSPHCVALAVMGLLINAPPAFSEGEGESLPLVDQIAVSPSVLEETRGQGGGTDFLQLNDMDLNADLNDNVIHSSTSGNNAISNGAFSESSGFSTVIQNSGNHVIIQNATIVNLKMGE